MEGVSVARASLAGSGVALVLLSAATFGTSGIFATSLIDSGWSAGAAVAARVCGGALLLTIPALWQLRRRWSTLRGSLRLATLYGVIAVAACQLYSLNAVAHLSIGVALLIEYLCVLMVVGWMWLRHHHRPRPMTIVGSALSVGGLGFVLDLTGRQHIDPVGVLWALAGAVGCAVYYVLSARSEEPLPAIAMSWAAMVIGGLVLVIFGAAGAVPMTASFHQVSFASHQTSWLVPIVGLALLASALAYVFGVSGARRLGPKLSSFLGLTEVLFAVVFAWLVLGQLPAGIQLVGGALIVTGVTLVRIDELKEPDEAEPLETPLPALAA